MNIRLRNRTVERKQRRRAVRRGICLTLALVLGLALWRGLQGGPEPAPPSVSAPAHASPPPAPPAPVAPAAPQPVRESQHGIIRTGDTLSALLGDHLTPQQIHALAERSKPVFPLTRICAGQPYELCTVDGEFDRFVYDIDREEQLRITAADGGFEVSTVPIVYQVEVDLVRGSIDTSLFESVSEIGEEAELAIALADIFAWDIDFIRDIRQGDSYQALVERRYRDQEPAGYGRILAAEFINRGEPVRAVLFRDGDKRPSYYDEEGHSMRKAFLKAPLAFSRISSGFSRRRFHPITKTWKAHPAIDYAAPTGTPIKTVGDGTIIEKGYTRGNGNYIKVRHNSTYQTLYLHMSRFARGMQKGRRVAQGDVIGYVGATGLATGPHLCFRMYKNGSPVNPLREKSLPSEPISPQNRVEFTALAAQLTARFDPGTDVALSAAADAGQEAGQGLKPAPAAPH